MSQVFTIIAIIGFSLAAVLLVVAAVMFFKLNIREVRNDLTGKTATRSIAQIRARAKTRKRTVTEAGKKLGWDSSEPIKMPSGPLKSYATDVPTKDIEEAELQTSYLANESEDETTLLTNATTQADSSRSASNVDDEPATSLLEDEGATTMLTDEAPVKEAESEEETTLLDTKGSTKVVSSIVVLLVAALVFTLGPGALEAQATLTTGTHNGVKTILNKMHPSAIRLAQSEPVAEPVVNEAAEEEAQDEPEEVMPLEQQIIAPFAVEDETAPVFGNVAISPNDTVIGTMLTASEKVVLTIEISDEAPVDNPSEPVSNVNPDSIEVMVNGQPYPKEKVIYHEATMEDPERITIEFEPTEGQVESYLFANISISAKDNKENQTGAVLLSTFDFTGIDLDDGTTVVSITGFTIDGQEANAAITFDNNLAYNTNYYAASRTATFTIADNRFGYYKTRSSLKNKVIVKVTDINGSPLETYAYSDFVQDSSDPTGNTWICAHEFSQDGYYEISFYYRPPGKGRVIDGTTFYIDTVSPTINTAALNITQPVVWNWITSTDDITLTFGVTDEFSGIDTNAINATIAGTSIDATYSSTQNTLTLAFPAGTKRILLDDIDLQIYDMAHNESLPLDLRGLLGTSVEEGTLGFIADSDAPEIIVAYDNNSVQNAQYYNAPRTATVTILEDTLDLIQQNDPTRTILTVNRDGSKSTLQAKDFTNPSNDGSTWIAQYDCSSDGTYALEASLTDIAGNVSNTVTDAFIIDQNKPLIMLTFDNNDVESGMYYKAARTATITINETNFSADLTAVAVSATNAAGAAVAAPGISGWTQEKPGVWKTTVHFSQELHYSLAVNCTDLAGNVAEEAREPEFVIDMTMPVVRVDKVANNTAYAGEVAPLVYFEDTNFEAYLSKVVITRGSTGESAYFTYDEALAAISRTLTFEDFAYELSNDDVYTLVATIKDKAGNTAEVTVVFSVNRFGSNYEFSTKTKPFIGSYLQEAQEVVVIETNVSGLETSQVRLARNNAVSTLSNEDDYTVTALGGQDGWTRYEYVFPAELFEDDAYYRILLSSEDLAGNYSENLMMGKNETRDGVFEVSFAVDGTSPLASFGSITDDSSIFSPSHLIDVYAGDNMEIEKATLYVNDQAVQTWSANELYEQAVPAYELAASDSFNEVRLEVIDRAGNTTVAEANKVLITNDIMRYISNTPSLLYPLIAVLSVLVALAVVLAIRLGKKMKAAKAAEEEVVEQ